MNTIVILSITSDLGAAMARRYASDGWRVVGSYRTPAGLAALVDVPVHEILPCDLADRASIEAFIHAVSTRHGDWDTLLSCPCEPLPVEPFLGYCFDAWQQSVELNSLAQLRVLHGMAASRRRNPPATAIFWAGGGMNGPVRNLSAYTAAKVLLAKMCELVAHEQPDLRTLIVGPGWVRTKVHDRILAHLGPDDERRALTTDFLAGDGGTQFDDIYDCLITLSSLEPALVSGRNFSVVHDPWRDPVALRRLLASDPSAFKLRRSADPASAPRERRAG